MLHDEAHAQETLPPKPAQCIHGHQASREVLLKENRKPDSQAILGTEEVALSLVAYKGGL